MGRVRQRGTELELLLRKALWQAGIRYRLKTKIKLPGSPDLFFFRAKIAVFVDGCFWHGCPIHGTMSKTNTNFWRAKIARNRERDAEVDAKLSELGWHTIRIWEHEIKEGLIESVIRISNELRAVSHEQHKNLTKETARSNP
jgi:DNA mismatch endonuclease, patch repair protein